VLQVGGTNQVPAGLDGGDDGGDFCENHFPSGLDGGVGGKGASSSLSQMSAHRSDTSPAAEPELTGDELPISVLAALVGVKLPKSVDVKLEVYWHMSVYARCRRSCTVNCNSSGVISNSQKVFFITS